MVAGSELTVAFEVGATTTCPECRGNRAALDRYGRNGLSLLLELSQLAFCLPPPFGHRHIRLPPK